MYIKLKSHIKYNPHVDEYCLWVERLLVQTPARILGYEHRRFSGRLNSEEGTRWLEGVTDWGG